MSLRHWQQMGGVNINQDLLIDKSIHKAINSRSSVLKVKNFCLLKLLFMAGINSCLYQLLGYVGDVILCIIS